MSVQVSYKKQFVLGIMLLVVILAVVEVLVNIWLYYFYTCDFEKTEVPERNNPNSRAITAEPETNRKLCLESLAYGFTQEKLAVSKGTFADDIDENLVYINSQGFRGPEFTEIKGNETYRIFIMGGSTAFGLGVIDNQTFPYYLQTQFDKSDLDFKVEVINTGWPGLWSLDETEMIKKRLLGFEPDLFIVYDGANDLNHQILRQDPFASPKIWKERWMEICDLGMVHGYDTIITLQPLVNTGKKIVNKQEYRSYIIIEGKKITEPYPQYVEQLDELKNHCSFTADLRGLFDTVYEPIYFDPYHTGSLGNQIIAEKLYQISLPVVMTGPKNNVSNNGNQESHILGIEDQLVSNDFDAVLEQSYITVREIFSSYMTPRIAPLIFK